MSSYSQSSENKPSYDPNWEQIRVGHSDFPGDFTHVNGHRVESRRPMIDAYLLYVQAYEYTDGRLVISALRDEAEAHVCVFCLDEGYNFIHTEEFEFLVDKHVWENFSSRRWNDADWPWPIPVDDLRDGEVCAKYDNWLTKQRRLPLYVSSSTQTMTDERSSGAMDWYFDTEVKRHSPRKRPKYDDYSGHVHSIDDFYTVNAHSVHVAKEHSRAPQLERRLSSMEIRLAKIEEASTDQGINTW